MAPLSPGEFKATDLPEASPLGMRFAKGAFWALVGTVVSQGLFMLASMLLARLLGREQFGRFDVINGTVLMFGIFAGMGAGLTAIKYAAQYRQTKPEEVGKVLWLSLAITVVGGLMCSLALVVSAPFLAAEVLNAPTLVVPLRLAAAVLFFTALGGMLNSSLAGFEVFRTIARINFLRGVFVFPAMIVGVWWWGLEGAIAAQAVTGVVWCIASWISLLGQCRGYGIRLSRGPLRRSFPMLLHYSLPALLSQLLATPALWAANALLANHPGGWSELGVLGAANQWRNVLILLPTIFSNVTMPMIAAGLEQAGQDHTERVLDISLGCAILSVVPSVVALAYGADLVLGCYGREFAAGVPLFVVLLAGVGIAGVGNVVGAVIQAHGKMWVAALLNLGWSIVYLATVLVLLPRWGGMALSAGMLAGYLAMTLWGFSYLYRIRVVSKPILQRVLFSSGTILALALPAVALAPRLRLIALLPAMAAAALVSFRWGVSPSFRRRILEKIR